MKEETKKSLRYGLEKEILNLVANKYGVAGGAISKLSEETGVSRDLISKIVSGSIETLGAVGVESLLNITNHLGLINIFSASGDTQKKKRIFVCSPYGGDPKMLEYAECACRWVMEKFDGAPFAPHLHYGIFLNEATERELGISCGKAYLETCDEFFVFVDHGISHGMIFEEQFARELGIPIKRIIMRTN